MQDKSKEELQDILDCIRCMFERNDLSPYQALHVLCSMLTQIYVGTALDDENKKSNFMETMNLFYEGAIKMKKEMEKQDEKQ